MDVRLRLKKIIVSLLCMTMLAAVPLRASALTIGEERRIGEKLLFSVRGEFTILDDPDIHHYINSLGKSVLDIVGPQYFNYHFFVVESSQFNAFAAPAGLVFFYTGLIETMQNEDELLSVLAHEIGHVVSRHIAQRLDKGGKISAATLALGVASLALGIPALSQGLLTGSLAAGQALQLQYSRNDEEQADRLSFEWMQRMQRNPGAMEGMLRTMRRIARYRSGQLPQYLLTHPNPEARLDYVQSLVAMDEHQRDDYYTNTDNFAFLRFKYRVLQQTKEPEKLRIYCANTLATSKVEIQRVMANYGLALLASDEHNPERALESLAKVEEAFPGRTILDIDRAAILAENGHYKQARDVLIPIVERNPLDMYGVWQLAQVEHRLGNPRTAKDLFTRVAGAMPQSAQIYYELGRVYAELGQPHVSRFYLGKYSLYKGKVKSAKQYFKDVSMQTDVPEKIRNEALSLLERLKELEKDN